MTNPLSAYFRQPSLYIQLPSGGNYWPEGSIQIPVTGELAVLSMTAADEILLKTPDALFNGEATVNLIQNCVPAIQDAWQTPMLDLETILIAIRIASVSESLSIETQCPKCSETSDFDLDLKQLLQDVDANIWQRPLKVGALTFTFRPISFYTQTQYNNQLFQYRKRYQQLDQIADTDQKSSLTSEIINSINSLEIQYMIDSIQSISVSGQSVTEPEHISEFMINCEKQIYSQVQRHTDALKATLRKSNLELHCSECSHKYVTEFSMEYSSFFDLSS